MKIVLTVALVLLTAFYLMLALHPIWDVDIFWHVVAGKWIVQHYRLPDRDIFSAVDPDRVWVTFQWLYEVICHGVDRVFGLDGLRVIHALAAAGGLLVVGLHLRREKDPLAGLVAVSLLAFLFADRLRVRPDVFNLLFMAAYWTLLRKDRLDRRAIITVVVTAVVWANMHAGGALLAPILLAARCGGRGLDRLAMMPDRSRAFATGMVLWRESRRDLAVFVGVVLAMATCPGFVRGTWQAFAMLGPSEEFIPEWISTWTFVTTKVAGGHDLLAGVLPVLLFAGLVLGLFFETLRNRAWPRRGGLDLALAIPLLVLSLRHVRFLWLGAFVGLLVVVRWWPQAGPVLRTRIVRFMAAGLVLLLTCLDWHHLVGRYHGSLAGVFDSYRQPLARGYFPETAAGILADSGLTGGLVNHAPWGGYLLYRLWPAGMVFTDGRGNFGPIETQLLATWDRPLQRRPALERAYVSAPFAAIVHPDPFPLMDMDCEQWIQVHHDAVARIFVPAGQGGVRSVKALGHLLPQGAGYDASDGCALHRAFTAVAADRRLASGERIWERLTLSTRLDQGDESARLPLAAVHFDLGDYPVARALLEASPVPLSRGGLLLLGCGYLADGYRDDARKRLSQLIQSGLNDPLPAHVNGLVRVLLEGLN
jgi:hypothetical protein